MLFRSSSYPRFKSRQLTNGDWSGLAGMFGIPVSSLQIDGANSLKEITVYTCIKILSETLGKLPIKIYQDTSTGKQKMTGDYRSRLLKLRPNPYMSAFDFWKLMEVLRNIHGNAYAWLDVASVGRNAGQIQGIYPLKSEQMKVFVDDIGLLSSKNRVWYEYRDDAGTSYIIDSDSILHFKGMSINGLIGLSTIEMLRSNIENAKGASNFLNNSYRKGMQAAGILQYVGDLDEDKKNKLRDKFEAMSSGLINANRLAVMPLGVTYQPLQLKLTDAQFLENTRLTIQQLTAAFGIKPHQVNDQTKTSYASTSEANREFYTDTMLAILTMYEQELDYKMFLNREIDAGYYTKWNADVILRADPEKRYAMYKDAVQNALKTPNECRELEEDPAMPGGDVLYGNSALAPIDLLAQGIAFNKDGSKTMPKKPVPQHKRRSVLSSSNDLDKVNEIIDSLSDDEKAGLGDRYFYDDSQYRYIAEEDGKPVGFIENRATGKKGHFNCAVNPDYRGLGIADDMVDKAIRAAPDLELDKIFWITSSSNEASIGLAEKHGFTLDSADKDSLKFVLYL